MKYKSVWGNRSNLRYWVLMFVRVEETETEVGRIFLKLKPIGEETDK